ncbi:hypothetical protein [Grimontia marina]|uniref:Uncharacterized protein n=1 Tax=Grimontia marina TaxID=646534 RepID=A0A128FE92_9GAMM|nr:hypothetical protein [Grimontia marina]CZF84830.1 hypothetical protein GMA8713_03267 [Grimontia marina]
MNPEMHVRVPMYCWENIQSNFGDMMFEQLLFGYHQEDMDASFAPNHENAICALGKREGKWILDCGKWQESFKSRATAIKWARDNLAVKAFRDVNFALYDAGKPDTYSWVEYISEQDTRERLEMLFNRFGFIAHPLFMYSPFKSCRMPKKPSAKVWRIVDKYISELDEQEDLEVPYSAWLLDLPREPGCYYVCKRGSAELQKVEVIRHEEDGFCPEFVLSVLENDGTTYALYGERNCEKWMWCHCYE